MPQENNMSIWSLVAEASLLVQFVMLLLFLASVISWVMIVQRGLYLRKARGLFHGFERQFWSGIDLNQLYRQGNGKTAEGAENIFRAGFKEFTRLRQQSGASSEAVMEGSQRAMRVALSREEEKLELHLPFLASVASVSPYIGLFGTVWGIMNSFRGLANVHQATLATVAPGIAEALVATAMGLFAAIPAVLAYNRYSARAEAMLNYYHTFAEEFSAILHRQVHSKQVSS
ncbi:cell division and transport-associated protein TolQ [Marinimicrobium koreense]|jgi:biopolymer transport protein TolQ|uniref:Tol-Pal system protein TolQ n=2 Tax=Cellvibrionaceae TaxID=1706371 RepID=A0A3N1NUV8_9GAMM|nr:MULTISPECIES: protein TolQ [Marinimicrobium]MAN51882.1 protein TolQ [Marinimicrobium sp.]ROQ19649.1 cell division and transport-associated protein TolQ [Marinimicrobium koreense]|tara:strand:+ start:333 stop:1022 length:690 start_codon:yes stop_codon:yes gene_type:complete